MPIYTCECCKYNSHIKCQYEAHLKCKKHLNLISVYIPDEEEKSDIYYEIDNLKKDIAELRAENQAILTCLQEYKQIVADLSKVVPTPIPEPQTIVIQQTPVVVQKPVKESCNPRHIEKKLNTDPANQSVPDIEAYFKIKSEHISFNFDDIDDMSAVDRKYIVDKIVDFAKLNIKNNVKMPFRYIKSSWFVKLPSGWEKIEQENNKGKFSNSDTYQHNIIVSSFIFIIQNRFISYFDAVSPGWRMSIDTEATRLFSEVFGRQNYKNNELLRPLQDVFAKDPSCDERAFE